VNAVKEMIFPARLFCPTCYRSSVPSCVYVGARTSTLLSYVPFYDEDGKYHDHDPNMHNISFRCSRGHVWEEKIKYRCWCGWPEKVEKKIGAKGK